MQKILVTGASGFIGSFLCHYLLTEGFQVFGLYLTNPISNPEIISKTIDIRDKDSLNDYIVKNEINFIVHLAYKKGPEMEETIVIGTKNLVEACRKFNIGFLLMSTDIVFDGITGDYSEEIKPNPIIDYGKFKYEAEKITLEIDGYIIRTSLVFDSKSTEKMQEFTITSLKKNKETKLFVDEYRSPIEVRELVKGITAIIIDQPADKIWHIAGPEKISRFDYGVMLAKHFGLNNSLLKPISAKNFNRPLDTSLNCQKFYSKYFHIRNLESFLSEKSSTNDI